MQKQISRFFLLLSVLACCVSIATAKPQEKTVPDWKPAPELLPKLSAPVQTEFGSIRIPLGLKKSTHREKSAPTDTYMWESSPKESQVHRALALSGPPISEEMSRTYTLQRVVEEFLVGFERRFDDFKITPRQYGHINNNPAVRVRWSGVAHKSQEKAKGSLFAIRRGTKLFIILCAQNFNDDEGVQLSEAAALTFQPK